MRFKLHGRWYQLRLRPAKPIGDIFVCNSMDVCRAGYTEPVLKLVQWEDGGAWECSGDTDADPRELAKRSLQRENVT